MSYINILTDEVYYTGHSINGRLVCYFRSEKNVRGIYVKLSGKEHTSWEERETRNVTRDGKTEQVVEYVHYTGNNDIISQKVQLENGTRTMQGHHEYNFSFHLPYDLPSTYESTYGWIRYRIKACVDRPMNIDMETEKYFKLISPINLSLLGNPMSPMQTGEDKTVCCLCCASGPINVDMYLDRSGYTLGEFMRVRISCTNLSNRSIEHFEIRLKQLTEAKVTSPSHHSKYLDVRLGGGQHAGVGAHGEDNFEFLIELPKELAIYNFHNSRLFRCYNELKLTCAIDGCTTDIDLKLRPSIGHVLNAQEMAAVTPAPNTVSPYSNQPAQYNNYPTTLGFVLPGPAGPPPYPNPMPMPMPMPPIPGGSNYDMQNVFPGGAPTAPFVNPNDFARVHGNVNNAKEKEVLDDRPSAPFTLDNNGPSAPPPSYDEIQK